MKTDKQLKQDVEDELESDPSIDATRIGVEVADRIVTLSGHPPSYAEKLAIERAANRVGGVKALVVDMTVHLPDDDVRTDEDIAKAVRSVLHWTVGLHDDAVKVQVERGWITLSGKVDWAYQSHLAVRAISQMRSVTGVTDHIAVQGGGGRGGHRRQHQARDHAPRGARGEAHRDRRARRHRTAVRQGRLVFRAQGRARRRVVGAWRACRRRRPGDRLNPSGCGSLGGRSDDIVW